MNRLQTALRLNAIFSGVSGLAMILFHSSLAELFALTNSTVFWVFGLALIFFAGTIVLEILKQRRLPIIWIIIQDFIWVIGSAILLIIKPFGISSMGNNLITTVAIIVLGMAINQLLALRKTVFN